LHRGHELRAQVEGLGVLAAHRAASLVRCLQAAALPAQAARVEEPGLPRGNALGGLDAQQHCSLLHVLARERVLLGLHLGLLLLLLLLLLGQAGVVGLGHRQGCLHG